MRVPIDFAQSGCRDVRVDLRRDEAAMPEKLLDASDVGPMIEQVRREAVSERVRGRAAVEARLP